ncbi:hypothetical protein NQ318_018566 [Aromia moschata]|uniref:Endoplasmic reticulum junction formation protein lunapark n=1 Tax=Aromia moschata TaxID=1265417 RepID=A0AAV8ZI75_9CUCU|nr:hypothetical protein NQ318_018566 [Aromia moschata]
MGIIIGKFRKKKSTYDILEKLEQEITSIEEFGRSTEQARKKIVGRFVLLAILVYIVLACVLYIYYHKISSKQRLICIAPLIAFPFIIWLIKRFLSWYYSRKITKNEKKLVDLKDQKKKILDNVMETETYKVAKKILDKFGNEPVKQLPAITATESTPMTSKKGVLVPSSIRMTQTGLRQRNVSPQGSIRGRISVGAVQTPFSGRQQIQTLVPSAYRSVSGLSVVPSAGPIPGTPLPLPRSILPRDRSVLDKMVDYLVGDGPSNRYALICKRCSSHNGMALKEEFEYLSFRCCYCSAFNPACKKRPTGPKFESSISPTKALPAPDSSESDKSTDSDAESKKLIITELRSDSPDTGRLSDFDKLSDLDAKGPDSDDPLVDESNKKEVAHDSPMEVSDSVGAELLSEAAGFGKTDVKKETESEMEL